MTTNELRQKLKRDYGIDNFIVAASIKTAVLNGESIDSLLATLAHNRPDLFSPEAREILEAHYQTLAKPQLAPFDRAEWFSEYKRTYREAIRKL
jgi:hypothetical protein